MPPDLTILPEMLKEAGYNELAAFGKWHLGHSHHKYHPISQGFTSFYGHYNGAIDYYSHLRDGKSTGIKTTALLMMLATQQI